MRIVTFFNKGKIASVLILILLTFQSYSFAQTGSITGRVLDKESKDYLTGANVIINGTSLGAASDLEGRFVIRNIPAGEHKITVSYIGYNSVSQDITITANRTLEQDYYLIPQAIEGQTVTVTAQAQGQLEAINQQLTSERISNVVSETRIQELPDFNAAQALSRLPGISTLQSSGEANKIVIRGLAPQYNSVEIEGFRLASTGSTSIGVISQGGTGFYSKSITNDRSVDLSTISPYMLKSISVYKSLTPDLNANAIGGTVNMELREAPPELHADILWQSGYTQKSGTYGNYRGVASVSRRFFNDMLGVYVLGNIESYDRDADNMTGTYTTVGSVIDPTTGYRPVLVNRVEEVRHQETRKRYGANLILDYRLPSGSIKSINLFTRLSSDYRNYTQLLDYDGGNINFTYRSGVNDIDAALNSVTLNYDFDFVQMDLKFANTYSFNSLPESPYLQFFQTGGIIPVSPITNVNTVPDNLTYLQRYEAAGGGAANTYLSQTNLLTSIYKENNQSYKADFKFPFSLGTKISTYVKIGGEYNNQHHSNNQDTPYAGLNANNNYTDFIMDSLASRYNLSLPGNRFPASNFTSTDKDLYSSFLDNKFGPIYWMVDPTIPVEMTKFIAKTPQFIGVGGGQDPGGWFYGPYQTLANDYFYSEKYYAGYLMSEIKFLDFMIVGGVRYEKDNSEFKVYNMIDSRNPVQQPIDTVTTTPGNEFWMPMVQVRYKPFDWFDVRYAFTKTLARPDYHQLSPRISMDFALNNVWAGNPDLVPARAYNHDLILSFHNNEIGLFTVGGFYKTVKNFSYSTQYTLHQTAPAGVKTISDYSILGTTPKDGAKVYTYINSPYDAVVKGIEVDLQTRFWYLPFPLNGLVLGFNYTRISSKAIYPYRNDRSRANPNPPPRVLVEVFDSTRTGRLIDQPNDIMNSYLGYDYEGFSCRFSFVFQGNSVSYVGDFPEKDGFTRDYFRMDASARQILPWYGLELYLDIFNINAERNTSAQQSIGGFTNEQNYGLTANLGVRYRL